MQRETSLSSQVAGDNSNNYKFCIHSDFVVVNSCGYFIARKRYKKSTNIEIHTIHKNKYKYKSWQSLSMKASPEGSAERGLWPSEKQRPIPREKEDRGEGRGREIHQHKVASSVEGRMQGGGDQGVACRPGLAGLRSRMISSKMICEKWKWFVEAAEKFGPSPTEAWA